MQAERDDRFWKTADAQFVKRKAEWAWTQTAEFGRKKTIISVDSDEARKGEIMCKEICKYYDEDEGCLFYAMGSGYEHDMPCYGDDEDDVMPSNDQVNAKWISTKDRFPDEECNCLVTVKEWYTAVESIPTFDVVKVVRCKDCKWFNDFGCAIRIVDDSDKPKDNDFCSFGERKETEDE